MFIYYIGAVVLLLVPAIAVILWLRHLIRRWVAPVPASIDSLWAVKCARGLLLGAALFCISVLPAWVAGMFAPDHPGWRAFADSAQAFHGFGAAGLAALFAFQAAYEELLFRAIALGLFGILVMWVVRLLVACAPSPGRSLSRKAWLASGTAASAVVAFAFAFSHATNPGASALSLANIALAGVLLGLVAWIDGDVWGAWSLHLFWNFSLAVCGLPVSGIRIGGVGPLAGAVPGQFSGGRFGPEASLPNTLGLLAAIIFILWLATRRVTPRKGTGQRAGNARESRSP